MYQQRVQSRPWRPWRPVPCEGSVRVAGPVVPGGRGGARAGAGAGPGGQAAGGRGAARRPAPDLRHGQVHADEDTAGAGQYIL